eukprot:m.137956 g.137956  ORF g.137956 m.137956 type:complete len:242 (+) comp29963_c0_seq1:179-904(+)
MLRGMMAAGVARRVALPIHRVPFTSHTARRTLAKHARHVKQPMNLSSNANVATDHLLFSCNRDSFFKVMAVAAISQCTMFALMASLALEMQDPDEIFVSEGGNKPDLPVDGIKQEPDSDKDSESPPYLKYGFSALSVGISVMFLSFGIIIPRRFVSSLTLLRGGEMLRVQTYQIVGKRAFEIPVAAIKMDPRLAYERQGKTSILTIGDTRHLLDGQNGEFINARMFNWLVKAAKTTHNTWN